MRNLGRKYTRRSQPLVVCVDRGQLIVKIGIDCLSFSAENGPHFSSFHDDVNDFRRDFKITDALRFAKGVASMLREEWEDGSTPITKAIDDAVLHAIENDCGVDETSKKEAVELCREAREDDAWDSKVN